MQSITDLWQRIDQWLATHAPRILEELNPGASETDLAEAEAALGFALPEDFKTFYHVHNGGGIELLGLLEHMSEGLYSLQGIVANRWINELPIAAEPADFLTTPERRPPPVQPVMWHPGWVIFAGSINGTYNLSLDLAPATGGQVGQIILHEEAVGPTLVIAPSLQMLLTQWVEWLESGDISYGEDDNGRETLISTHEWGMEWMMLRDRPQWNV